jgi:orotidine-5'-phosphate decarboxylase
MSFSIPLSNRLFIALDFPNPQQALAMAQLLAPLQVSYKIGMQLFYAKGNSILPTLQQSGQPVFVDLKLHDIPNTVAGAVQSLVEQGVDFFNVHTQGGLEMMRAAADSAVKTSERLGVKKPTLLGVTLLTSLGQQDLNHQLKVEQSITVPRYVCHMARQAQDAGLDGVVCSAQEAALLKEVCGDNFLLVTPGIRLSNAKEHDQTRIMSPAAALKNGAHYLVVGRPVTESTDPCQAVSEILAEMATVDCTTPRAS